MLLVIYIVETFSLFSVKRRNYGKKDANFFAWEEDSMTSVDSNFNFLCGRPHGAGHPPPPVHMRPPEPDPLHVDVINEWPLSYENVSNIKTGLIYILTL